MALAELPNMSKTSNLAVVARTFGVTALLALSSGCYAEAEAEPAYVDTEVSPVEYESAPTYVYEGRPVYYVHDHWYAHDSGRWRYYRSEPAPLARYRTQVRQAPRAPERRESPAAHAAPRAHRVE